MTTYTNYLSYPSFEIDTNVDGLADGWDVAKSITGTEVYSRVAGRLGGYAQCIQYTGVAGDAAGKYFVFSADTPVGSFLEGDVVTGSYWVKGSSSGCTCMLYISYYDADHNHLGDAGDVVITNSAEWTRFHYHFTALADTSYLQLRLQITAIHEGDTFDFSLDDAAMIDKLTITPYFDGGQTFRHYADSGWTGTTNASTSTCGPQDISGIPWYDGPWVRSGAVFATHVDDELESSVIKDGATWKMWYTQSGVSYATAPSPYGPWTPYAGNPVLAESSGELVSGATVLKSGGLYHMFVGVHSTPITHDYLTSLDGITWTLVTHDIMELGAAGEFDDISISRQFVWIDEDDGHWYMIYEAYGSIFPGYTGGIATAIDPAGPWTKWTQNPVVGGSDANLSPTCMRKIGDRYYLWMHGNCEIDGLPVSLPTDVARAYGETPYILTRDPTSVLVRQTADEGAELDIGQCADTCVVLDGDTLYMFYTATLDGTGPGPFLLKMAHTQAQPYSVLAEAKPTIADISVSAGDTAPLSLSVPYDLTGCTATFAIATSFGATALVTTTALIVVPATGLISVPMAESDTSGLRGFYSYEVQVTNSGGLVKTLLYGRFIVRGDIV